MKKQNGSTPRVQGSGPVPQSVLRARAQILAAHSGGGDCTRCGGEGYLEENESWIVAKGKKGVGKVCFRCEGDGIEPGNHLPDPLTVRANVVAKLKPMVEAGDVVGISKAERGLRSGPFWPVLEDAFQRAERAAKARRSGKVASAVTTALQTRQQAPERPPVRTTRVVSAREFLSKGLNGYFADVLEKHHPGASAEEFADAMGGHVTFGGDVVFDEDEEF